ncbi:MAG: Flp pilus assembly protein CpaB [Gammaproteobacteria bacterium]|nr:Flp pilus assembly protein CpaB [Gammaproteobacteria bacterium]
MNMQAMRILAMLLALGAVVLGYIGYKLSTAPVETPQTEVQPVAEPESSADLRRVIIASRRIEAGAAIMADDLDTIRVPVVREGAFHTTEPLLERTPAVPVAAGEIVLESHFHSGSRIARLLEPGMRAIAVKVDEVIGGGAYVQPGDHVDVLVYLRGGMTEVSRSTARILLERAEVLAYGKTVAVRQDGRVVNLEDDPRADPGSRSAVLAVPREQAGRLMLAEHAGAIRLAVVSSRETEELGAGGQSGSARVMLDELAGDSRPSRSYSIPVYRGTERSAQTVSR